MLPSTPCKLNPCGPNSQCRPRGDESVCTCLSDFIGSPPNCRAECVSNSECSNHLACINKKCQDPCVGSCGANANCHVVSHTPMCSCINDYTGDPFTQCILRERKYQYSGTSIISVTCWMFDAIDAGKCETSYAKIVALSLSRINVEAIFLRLFHWNEKSS